MKLSGFRSMILEFQNTEKYISLIDDPLPMLKKRIRNLVDLWKKLGVFDENEIFRIEVALLARAYGLTKVHKEGFPLMIVASIVNSPLYDFDKWLSKLLSKSITKPVASVKNSLEIKNFLENNIVPKAYVCMSLDVVGLFPNLPHNLILECLYKNWKFIKNNVPLSKHKLLNGVNLFLNSTFFQFDGKYYRQTLGSPIGSCTSPIFAEVVLEALKINSINKLKSSNTLNPNANYYSKPPVYNNDMVLMYKRYVDDLFLIVKEDQIEPVQNIFNSFNSHLQFTVEKETNNIISFLDIKMKRNENGFVNINWFRKNLIQPDS